MKAQGQHSFFFFYKCVTKEQGHDTSFRIVTQPTRGQSQHNVDEEIAKHVMAMRAQREGKHKSPVWSTHEVHFTTQAGTKATQSSSWHTSKALPARLAAHGGEGGGGILRDSHRGPSFESRGFRGGPTEETTSCIRCAPLRRSPLGHPVLRSSCMVRAGGPASKWLHFRAGKVPRPSRRPTRALRAARRRTRPK